MSRHIYLILLCYFALTGGARAALTIDITQGEESALPVAVVPFAWTGASSQPPEDIADIVRGDLRLSGRLAPLKVEALPQRPSTPREINFQLWRALNTPNLVIGRVQVAATGYQIEFQLFDVLKGEQILGYSFNTDTNSLRRVAHRISDMIYEALTGEAGAFNSRVAFVTVRRGQNGENYQLRIADIDGKNPRTILTSTEPLLSPAWSPDGETLAYVSFEHKRTAVYVQDIRSGRRQQVAAWPGLNAAPAWSPDGTRLALSLSKEGNPEIHVLNLVDNQLQRLTHEPAIDTEPTWSPDGRLIAFTSDRGGSPQIYLMPSAGGPAKRISFAGSYNAAPDFSPKGDKIALLNGNGNSYSIAVLDLAKRHTSLLSQTGMDESPCFAPNGGMVIYATGRELAAVSTDGKVLRSLAVSPGEEVREPAWSPLLK